MVHLYENRQWRLEFFRKKLRILSVKSTMNARAYIIIFAAALLMACGGGGPSPTAVAPTLAGPSDAGQISMGGAALGGNASTTVLAQIQLADVSNAPLSWMTHRWSLGAGESLRHSHPFAFIYAENGPHRLTSDQVITEAFGEDTSHTVGQTVSIVSELAHGEGAPVMGGPEHLHEAPDSPSTFWETRLDYPDYVLADPRVETVFVSSTLEGIPENPLAVFVLVEVPVGGETSVHTHPGPEFIYQLSGGINYQNDIVGVRQMTPGDIEGIPPVTSVQKRNPSGETAAFLSWFLVDPNEPFASPAFFHDTGLAVNLALLENGASVAGVSSNFAGGANDSAFGAANALDGNPATEWSSASDGNSAWIDVELAAVTNVTSVGFWTRTMGDTAQVNSFQVTTERGETYGPFTIADATTIYRFDTQFTAQRLRFELLDTSGGNTGALEIEVYGEVGP
jgi:quercetin dioxygenase-like cupin family protein